MRNLKRLSFEIKVLEARYGFNNVTYNAKGDWVKIEHYPLSSSYNQPYTTILIRIPENYDTEPVRDLNVDARLKVRNSAGQYITPPGFRPGALYKYGYLWKCFELTSTSKKYRSLLAFINTIRLYFDNPFTYGNL